MPPQATAKMRGGNKCESSYFFCVKMVVVIIFTPWLLGDEVDGPRLGPESLAGAVDPDVHGLDLKKRTKKQ